MIAPGRFLCGCSPAEKKHYSGDVHRPPFSHEDIYTDKRYDRQGFEVCPEHGERMYGWKSVPVVEAGAKRQDFSGLSSGEYKPSAEVLEIEDRRDNRDPEEVFLDRKREKAQSQNGHA